MLPQVTGEANLTGVPGGVDGAFPRAAEALVRGVLSAAEAKRVAEVVGWVLRTFREQTLPIAGIPAATPIRICENGWPTGPDRPARRTTC